MTTKTMNHSAHGAHGEKAGTEKVFAFAVFAVHAVVKKGLPA
jgi:hypothetical protein